MRIVDCEQGSDAWFRARAGIPTASEFATVMARGRGGGESKTRQTYLYKLAGEVITGEPTEGFSNAHTDRGKALEPEARDFYAMMSDTEPQQVGFVVNEARRCGCSPDSLVGDAGALEIKTKLPHLLIEALLRDEVPPEHKAQCQGVLWIAEREWIDVVVYWPRMPTLIKRAYRDETYIRDMASAVDVFNGELHELVGKLRQMRGDREAA